MERLRFTLLADGSSDKALMRILRWLLEVNGVTMPIDEQWADLSRLPRRPDSLEDRILTAIDLAQCDLLFVHRDGEREGRSVRVDEIRAAVSSCGLSIPAVCVVPVRMTEAWLLFNEHAIRKAAGNPNGRVTLNLPRVRDVERLPDPKAVLNDAIRIASELSGRRLKGINMGRMMHLVAEYCPTFEPLRSAPAFNELEIELVKTIKSLAWI